MSEPVTTRYHLKGKNLEGWGVFFISSDGCLAVLSDYGNYGYRWPDEFKHPHSFKRFLTEIDAGYLYRKFNGGRRHGLDYKRTRQRLRLCVGDKLRNKTWSQEQAKAELVLIDDMCLEDQDWHYYSNNTELQDVSEQFVEAPDSDLVMFTKRLWPRFVEALRAELGSQAPMEASP